MESFGVTDTTSSVGAFLSHVFADALKTLVVAALVAVLGVDEGGVV